MWQAPERQATKCTVFRANVPYFEQNLELLGPQVKRNQLVAKSKANRGRMDPRGEGGVPLGTDRADP
jgi:ABC-type iron transport system FetAB ATPase subunit